MNATASGTVKDRRTAVIETAIDIARPAEVVFGYCSDHTNEIEWNPAMRRVAKITDGPVGAGTRYEMEFLPGRPMVAECVRFDPGLLGGGSVGQRHAVVVFRPGHSGPGRCAARVPHGDRTPWDAAGCAAAAAPPDATRPGPRHRPRQDQARRPGRPRPPGPGQPHGSEAALRAVKAAHTLAWFSIEAFMAYVLYAGFARRSDRRAGVAAAVVATETLIFAGNGSRCPLTQVAERMGAGRGRSPTSTCPGGSPATFPPSTSR